MPAQLAIEGGTPVRTCTLPYGHQIIDEDDIQAVSETLRSDWITTGPAVEAYEEAFAAYAGAKYAVAVSSGTAALHAAAWAAGVGPGDEAVTSPLSFAASANCVLYCGGRPVFADVQQDTCIIDPDLIEGVITPHTKAIIAVDYSGQPCDLDPINALAERHGLIVIEDAAHALGATYRGRRIGTLATMTVFSTHPVKHITTGEGGMVVTNDPRLVEKLRAFRNHGIAADSHVRAQRADWFYEMEFLGYNYRIPDILCALGRSQLGKLDGWLARRRALADGYHKAFAEVPEVRPVAVRSDRESAWHFYPVRIDVDRLRVDRRRVFDALRAEGIGVNVHYIPIYRHPYYRQLGYTEGLCPIAEAQYERLITLPLWAGMSDNDAEDVVAAVVKVMAAYRK